MQRLLTQQNERLLELDKLKDEFISLVSHELRTPLTSIRGYLELLLDDGRLDAEQQSFLGIIDRNSNRLLGLVSDLLMLTQIEAGGLQFDLGPVDLEEIVRESIDVMAVAACHSLVIDQRVEDCFFGCLDRRGEQSVHPIVRNGLDSSCRLGGIGRAGIRG